MYRTSSQKYNRFFSCPPIQIAETNNADADDRRQANSNLFLTCGTLTSDKSFVPLTGGEDAVDVTFKVDGGTQKKGFIMRINYPNE